MKLDDAQSKKVSAWIAEGLKLSEIQKRLAAEYGLNLTYMDVRLLVDDLKLVPKDPPPQKAEKVLTTPPSAASALTTGGTNLEEDDASPVQPAPGKVTLTADAVARPGALVSGSVTFSDGQPAIWYLDQMGRLGLSAKQAGYKPSAADLQSFQQALETELSKLGF